METHKVGDCLTKKYVSFTSGMPVVEAASKLLKNELIGGPVIDANKKLIGWISEQECLAVVTQLSYYADRVATVADVMQTEVVTVSLEDSLLTVAEQMKQAKPKIYPVVDENEKIVGVISRRMVLKELCRYNFGKV